VDLPQLRLPYKQKGKAKNCLANQKGSISHPITPQVINNLEADTHTHAHSHAGQKQFQETSCMPGLKTGQP